MGKYTKTDIAILSRVFINIVKDDYKFFTTKENVLKEFTCEEWAQILEIEVETDKEYTRCWEICKNLEKVGKVVTIDELLKKECVYKIIHYTTNTQIHYTTNTQKWDTDAYMLEGVSLSREDVDENVPKIIKRAVWNYNNIRINRKEITRNGDTWTCETRSNWLWDVVCVKL
jgi:hypothetical protein